MRIDPGAPFEERIAGLPRLGLGISTEFGAGQEGLDLIALRESREDLVSFLEIGIDLDRGVDVDARAWVERGWPVTYHFLDLNLEESEDLDEAWTSDARDLATDLGAAWMCGDAGLWHVGLRERGHGVLMPPILEPQSAQHLGENVRALREAIGFEVLPENPPAHVYAGRLHLLEYFAQVSDVADSGLLLDVAHLAVFQKVQGFEPLDGLDDLPVERVVEMHVAGGTPFQHRGRTFVEDDHGVNVLPETWRILEHVLPRATNLRALVFECERNAVEDVVPVFERLREAWDQ